MNGVGVLDVSGLPTLVSGRSATVWWGMVMLLAIETAVFGTLIVSYFYLRLAEPVWPPAGVSPPDLGLATVNTVVLVASSAFMRYGDQGLFHGSVRKLLVGLTGALVLATVFLVLKVVEYSDVPYRWDDHAYGSIVWLTVGFHTTHVISLVLKTLVIAALAVRGYFDEHRYLGVEVNGLYWHFVVIVWLPLYFVLYWAPRLLD
jgi:cytochrome c oxidase subunit III